MEQNGQLLKDISEQKRNELAGKIVLNTNWRYVGLYFEKEYGFTISETKLKKDHSELLPEARLCRHLINELAERKVSIQSFIDVLNNPNIGMNAIADKVAFWIKSGRASNSQEYAPDYISDVPNRLDLSIEREELPMVVDNLLDDTIKTVIVHGMGGIGKSTILTQIQNIVSIKDKFLIKRYDLPVVLDEKHNCKLSSENWENLKNYQGKKPLLIIIDNLVDVKQTEHEIFKIEAKKLVATRDKSIIEQCGKVNCFEKEVVELSPEKSCELLQRIKDGGSILLKKIAVKCGHIPLALKIVGEAAKRKNWTAVLRDLQRQPDKLLISNTHGLEKHHKTLSECLSVGYTALKEDLKPLLNALAIFPDSTPIPSEIISINWANNCTIEDDPHNIKQNDWNVHDIMEELVEASWIIRTIDHQYKIHNLVHMFLANKIKDRKKYNQNFIAPFIESFKKGKMIDMFTDEKSVLYCINYIAEHFKCAEQTCVKELFYQEHVEQELAVIHTQVFSNVQWLAPLIIQDLVEQPTLSERLLYFAVVAFSTDRLRGAFLLALEFALLKYRPKLQNLIDSEDSNINSKLDEQLRHLLDYCFPLSIECNVRNRDEADLELINTINGQLHGNLPVKELCTTKSFLQSNIKTSVSFSQIPRVEGDWKQQIINLANSLDEGSLYDNRLVTLDTFSKLHSNRDSPDLDNDRYQWTKFLVILLRELRNWKKEDTNKVSNQMIEVCDAFLIKSKIKEQRVTWLNTKAQILRSACGKPIEAVEAYLEAYKECGNEEKLTGEKINAVIGIANTLQRSNIKDAKLEDALKESLEMILNPLPTYATCIDYASELIDTAIKRLKDPNAHRFTGVAIKAHSVRAGIYFTMAKQSSNSEADALLVESMKSAINAVEILGQQDKCDLVRHDIAVTELEKLRASKLSSQSRDVIETIRNIWNNALLIHDTEKNNALLQEILSQISHKSMQFVQDQFSQKANISLLFQNFNDSHKYIKE